MVCLSWGNHKFRCNMVQCHNEEGPGLGCEEREGAGGVRQDCFPGKPKRSLLTKGTSGAIFKILQVPVVSTEGKKILSLVFIDPRSNLYFITHELAGQLQLEGTLSKIFIKRVNKE